MSAWEDRSPDPWNRFGVGAAEPVGASFALGLARSLDGGLARTLLSSHLRTSEAEGRLADGWERPRAVALGLAVGVRDSGWTLDRPKCGSERLDRVALGGLPVGEV